MLPYEETPGQAGRNLLAGGWETGSAWRASGGLRYEDWMAGGAAEMRRPPATCETIVC